MRLKERQRGGDRLGAETTGFGVEHVVQDASTVVTGDQETAGRVFP